MMFNSAPKPFIFTLTLLLLAGCSGLRYVPANEKLYTGASVKLAYPGGKKPKNASALQTEMTGLLRPAPSKSFLGLRPQLYFWHLGVGKKKGFGKFLADKLGKAPVYLSAVKIPATEGLIVGHLHNDGYFGAVASHSTKETAKTASITYTAATGPVYVIREIHFPARDTLVDAAIRATQPGSLLKVGDPYNLATFTAERVRIDNVLKNAGYYYFNPDFILFQVDSTLHEQVNVFMRIKPRTPLKGLIPYRLDQVMLNTRYVLTDTLPHAPLLRDGYQYIPDEKLFRASAITRATFLYPDSLYRRQRRDQTLSRLMSLGTFRFVEIRYDAAAHGDTALIEKLPGEAIPSLRVLPRLDARVLMTPLKKNSLRAELQLVSKSNNFTGPGLKVTFRDRSALRGAEQLLVNATAAFETQTRASSAAIGLTSYELGFDTKLLIPRLVVPDLPLLDVHLPNSDFQPRTTIGLGYKAVARSGFFQEDVFNFNYGYSFKSKITNEQIITPIDVSYVRLGSTTTAFDSLLLTKPFLRNSFQQQFILASSYRYTYNQQVLEQRQQQIYFSGGVEFSGNVAQGLASTLGKPNPETGRYSVLGQEFSQYTKVDLELREYYRISHNPTSGNRLVGRLLIGAGLPYGNSTVLPYIKQYGIGGPNSVRAFAARSIGPGTYRPTSTDETRTSFYDQVGDLRLEGNIEYRQDLVPYVKGAVFMDAGNIWLMNNDPARPGGQFSPSTFLNQLAVGAGAGIRIDVQFFVIRFDYAVPLRAGYGTPTGSDTGGRLNLAIGYPF